MAREIWVEPRSHYTASGTVSGGKMSDATVTDNNGATVDRNRSFDSKAEFAAWARKKAGIS